MQPYGYDASQLLPLLWMGSVNLLILSRVYMCKCVCGLHLFCFGFSLDNGSYSFYVILSFIFWHGLLLNYMYIV